MPREIRKRLDRLERRLIDLANQEPDYRCNCRQMTVVNPQNPEQFETDMNQLCLIHCRRDLGQLVLAKESLPRDINKLAKMANLLEEYKARRDPHRVLLDQLRRVGMELSDEEQKS